MKILNPWYWQYVFSSKHPNYGRWKYMPYEFPGFKIIFCRMKMHPEGIV